MNNYNKKKKQLTKGPTDGKKDHYTVKEKVTLKDFKTVYDVEGLELNKQKMLCSLYNNHGIIRVSCFAIQMSISAYYKYMREDAKFKEIVEDIQDNVVDKVESKLYELIELGDTGSVKFYMSTKGKNRGYAENIQIGSDPNKPIRIVNEIVFVNKEVLVEEKDEDLCQE